VTQTILLVDDDPLLCKLFETALRKAGFEAYYVFSGKAALNFLSERSADLIVLDMMMADLDGASTIEQIRDMAPYQATPVIMLTARVDLESKKRGMVAGASSYLSKPITPNQLLEQIKLALGEA
jgi:DNA-binding response OmpR family regulator